MDNQLTDETADIELRTQKFKVRIWIIAFFMLDLFNVTAVVFLVDHLVRIKQRVTGFMPLTLNTDRVVDFEDSTRSLSKQHVQVKETKVHEDHLWLRS